MIQGPLDADIWDFKFLPVITAPSCPLSPSILLGMDGGHEAAALNDRNQLWSRQPGENWALKSDLLFLSALSGPRGCCGRSTSPCCRSSTRGTPTTPS